MQIFDKPLWYPVHKTGLEQAASTSLPHLKKQCRIDQLPVDIMKHMMLQSCQLSQSTSGKFGGNAFISWFMRPTCTWTACACSAVSPLNRTCRAGATRAIAALGQHLTLQMGTALVQLALKIDLQSALVWQKWWSCYKQLALWDTCNAAKYAGRTSTGCQVHALRLDTGIIPQRFELQRVLLGVLRSDLTSCGSFFPVAYSCQHELSTNGRPHQTVEDQGCAEGKAETWSASDRTAISASPNGWREAWPAQTGTADVSYRVGRHEFFRWWSSGRSALQITELVKQKEDLVTKAQQWKGYVEVIDCPEPYCQASDCSQQHPQQGLAADCPSVWAQAWLPCRCSAKSCWRAEALRAQFFGHVESSQLWSVIDGFHWRAWQWLALASTNESYHDDQHLKFMEGHQQSLHTLKLVLLNAERSWPSDCRKRQMNTKPHLKHALVLRRTSGRWSAIKGLCDEASRWLSNHAGAWVVLQAVPAFMPCPQ